MSGSCPGGWGAVTSITPRIGRLCVFLVISALVTGVLGANDQELVLYYAVSVFMSFLVGLLAMARFSQQERKRRIAGAERDRRAGRRVHARR